MQFSCCTAAAVGMHNIRHFTICACVVVSLYVNCQNASENMHLFFRIKLLTRYNLYYTLIDVHD